jgi:hypothetical protein
MIVKYSKKFPYAPYLNFDVGLEEERHEVSIDNPESVLDVLRKMDAIAEQYNKEKNQQPEEEYNGQEFDKTIIERLDYSHKKDTPIINIQAERIKDLIADCENLGQLSKFKEEATKAGLQNEYMNKLKQFL